jgi:hypothetical protein
MSDLVSPLFSYRQYVDDKQKQSQTGTVDSDVQKQSPTSAGSRGLRRVHDFIDEPVHMMGESITMEDIKTLITKIDILQSK